MAFVLKLLFFLRFVWFLSELLNTVGHCVSVSSSGVHVPAVPQPGLYPFPGRVSQRHKASEPPGGPRIGHPQTLWLWQVSNISRLWADLSVCIFHFCIVVTISVSLWIFSLLSVCVALFLGLRFPCVDHSCLFLCLGRLHATVKTNTLANPRFTPTASLILNCLFWILQCKATSSRGAECFLYLLAVLSCPRAHIWCHRLHVQYWHLVSRLCVGRAAAGSAHLPRRQRCGPASRDHQGTVRVL